MLCSAGHVTALSLGSVNGWAAAAGFTDWQHDIPNELNCYNQVFIVPVALNHEQTWRSRLASTKFQKKSWPVQNKTHQTINHMT